MKKGLTLLILTVLLLAISFPAMAIEIVYPEETPVKYGVGVELFGFYAGGISGTYNINDQIAVQGIIGAPNIFVSFSGVKLMYRFAEGESRNYYLFGTGGVVSGSPYYTYSSTTGTGWAGGFGVEYSPDYLPDYIRSSIEIGYAGTTLADLPTFLYFNYGFRVYF